MPTFLYYALILAVGIGFANVIGKVIDFSLYKFVQYLYKRSLQKQFYAAQEKMLQEAEPGIARDPDSFGYGGGLN